MTQMNYTVGSLVKARGREWVVLPESDEQVLILRPLGGSDQEVTGIYRGLEEVEPASFDPPDPQALGDYRSGRLLRDAVRLAFAPVRVRSARSRISAWSRAPISLCRF